MPDLKAKIDTNDLAEWVLDLELAVSIMADFNRIAHPELSKAKDLVENVKNSIEREHFNAF